jgi:hypothetical protein
MIRKNYFLFCFHPNLFQTHRRKIKVALCKFVQKISSHTNQAKLNGIINSMQMIENYWDLLTAGNRIFF